MGRRAYFAGAMESRIAGALEVKSLSGETKQAIRQADERMGEEIEFAESARQIKESIMKNDMPYDKKPDPAQAVLPDYFSAKDGNREAKIKIANETSQDITANELSKALGVGRWSRSKGVNTDVCDDELKEMGTPLRGLQTGWTSFSH